MGVESKCTFADLPLKPLTATRTTHLVLVVQFIEGAKLPMPNLERMVPRFAKQDYITMGPQCGLGAILEDIQSYQIACIPKENSFDIVKMIRFHLRTSVKKIMSAFFSPTYLVDMSLVTSKNKTPAVMQHLFEQLGGNQVVMKYGKGRFLFIFRRTETPVYWQCIDKKKKGFSYG